VSLQNGQWNENQEGIRERNCVKMGNWARKQKRGNGVGDHPQKFLKFHGKMIGARKNHVGLVGLKKTAVKS